MANKAVQQSIRDLYDTRSATYEDSHHPAFVQDFLKFLGEPLKPGDIALDLACGTGLVTFSLAHQVAPNGKVHALDISQGMLDVAMAKQKDFPLRTSEVVYFQNHSIDDLDSSDLLCNLTGKIDLITCASALVLLPDPAAAIKSWASYLRPGVGRLLVDALPASTMPAGIALDKVCTNLGIPLPYSRLWMRDEAAFRVLLESSGSLVVERCEFVQQNATGPKRYDLGKEEAERKLDDFVSGHMKGWYATLTDVERVKIKEKFVGEWAALANEHGYIEDLDGVFVALSRSKG